MVAAAAAAAASDDAMKSGAEVPANHQNDGAQPKFPLSTTKRGNAHFSSVSADILQTMQSAENAENIVPLSAGREDLSGFSTSKRRAILHSRARAKARMRARAYREAKERKREEEQEAMATETERRHFKSQASILGVAASSVSAAAPNVGPSSKGSNEGDPALHSSMDIAGHELERTGKTHGSHRVAIAAPPKTGRRSPLRKPRRSKKGPTQTGKTVRELGPFLRGSGAPALRAAMKKVRGFVFFCFPFYPQLFPFFSVTLPSLFESVSFASSKHFHYTPSPNLPQP